MNTDKIATNLKAMAKAHIKKPHKRGYSKCFDFNHAISLLYPSLTHDEKQKVYKQIIAQ